MKKIIFSTLAFMLLASPHAESLEAQHFKTLIKSAKLYDGRKIDFSDNVEKVHVYEEKIDYLELNDGEIVDRTDIKSLYRFKTPSSYHFRLESNDITSRPSSEDNSNSLTYPFGLFKVMRARTGVDGGG